MKIKPVWISSMQHLSDFNRIASAGGTGGEITSRTPKEFPHIKINHYRIPLVLFSAGSLELKEDGLIYKSEKKINRFYKDYYNIDYSLTFSIQYSEINYIARYHITTYNENYSINWIRIVHNSENIFNNVLVSYGDNGLFAMRKIRSHNEKLVAALKSRVEEVWG